LPFRVNDDFIYEIKHLIWRIASSSRRRKKLMKDCGGFIIDVDITYHKDKVNVLITLIREDEEYTIDCEVKTDSVKLPFVISIDKPIPLDVQEDLIWCIKEMTLFY